MFSRIYRYHCADHVLPCFYPSSNEHLLEPILLRSVLIQDTVVSLTFFYLLLQTSLLFASLLQAVSTMAPHSQPVGSDNKENQTNASSDLTKTFSDNSSDSDSTSDLELYSEDSDDKDEDEPTMISLMMRASCLMNTIWPKWRA